MKVKDVLMFCGIALLVYGGWFVYQNLRGAAPAFGPISREAGSGSARPTSQNTTGLPLNLPAGFSISVFGRNLSAPRVLARDPSGTLITSIPSQSKVVALPDRNNDGVSDETITVFEGLSLPHGLAFHDGKLYIAETNQVAMYDYNPDTKKASNKKKLFDFPGGGNHFSRTIGFSPDGKLYISVGSSCNVCNEKDSRRAKILVANADGTGLRQYASGLRNSVFFTWHPKTGDMWATEMGRDLLGDNIPPEEINIIKQNANYGWPYCYSDKIHDDKFDPKHTKDCNTTIAPHITFQAHSAPLGLAFIPDSWPEEYRGDLLVSYHGSWNRSEPTGYKVVRFDLDKEFESVGESDFITGFLQGASALGRPVDLLFDTKGTLYVSDDKAGLIYRIALSP